jgi:hypothetical protein
MAIVLIPVIFFFLVIAHGMARAVMDWPDPRFGGWVLLGIAVLSLLPVLLVLIELLATAGGSVKVAGVAFSFTGESMMKVAEAVRSTTLAENLETPSGAPVSQSSLRSILRALRRAHDSEVTVVDLRGGQTWWETRLFILIAGAARTGRPLAIAFVGERNGKQGAFLGWAAPERLLGAHLAAEPDLADAYHTARREATQWRIGTPAPPRPGKPPSVMLPWAAQLELPPVDGEPPDPAFADELFLQAQLDRRDPESQRHVTIQRLMELYEAVLVTDRVDVDADIDAWAKLLRSSQQRFFAMTTANVFKALVPREAVLSTLVAQLAPTHTAQ